MGITKQGNQVILENNWLRRVIDIEHGICTKKYHIRPNGNRYQTWYPVFSFEESAPFEAAVTLNGVEYEASPFQRAAGNDLWTREGSFSVENVVLAKGKYGDTADIVLKNRFDRMPEVELHLLYEVCEEQPFLSKRIRLINKSERSITVNHMTVDILRFFDRRLALSVFSNYYRDVKREDRYYFCWTRLEFPDPMDFLLEPGESVDSFDLYEAATSMDRQEESVILQRIYKKLAPWICDIHSGLCTNSCQTYEELLGVADRAQEDGYDTVSLHVGQVFTNTGDYIPRPDLFPRGYDDVKRLIAYYHGKGLRILPYCSATIAWRDSLVCIDHPDWQCLGPDGLRYDPFGLGNMCYHSAWGDYIREKLFYLIDEVGFDGLALDGPVHELVCLETNHKHNTEKSVNYMNWRWEKQFYGEIAAKGKLITAPETWNAILMGISEIPGGHREEDENELGGMELLVMKRACAYEARYATPPCCHGFGIPIDPYHGHSIDASEEDTVTYEHAAATSFGYGFNSGTFGKAPYIGPNTKEIYKKWLGIFRKYRETLKGDFIHLSQPNGCEPDGVLHTNCDAEVPGIAMVFNPTGREATFSVVLPMRFANLYPNERVEIEGHIIELDSLSGAPLTLRLAPYEVRAIPILRVNESVHPFGFEAKSSGYYHS